MAEDEGHEEAPAAEERGPHPAGLRRLADVVVAEGEGAAAQDDAHEHDHQRDVKAPRHLHVDRRERDEEDHQGDDDPDVVRLPDRSDGLFTGCADLRALVRRGEHLHDPDAEVRAAADHVEHESQAQEARDEELGGAHRSSPRAQRESASLGGGSAWAWRTCRRHIHTAHAPISA